MRAGVSPGKKVLALALLEDFKQLYKQIIQVEVYVSYSPKFWCQLNSEESCCAKEAYYRIYARDCAFAAEVRWGRPVV